MSNRSLIKEWRRDWNRNLLRFLGRRARDCVDIEDLAQETYLRLLRARDLEAVRNPQAYLIQVANHVVLDWRERQPPADRLDVMDVEAELADESSPELEVEATLSQARLEKTLASVSPVMRAALILRLRDEKSYEQIAAELGMTLRQVKRYLARGFALLHATLET